jgi:hypothetical protein
MLGDVSRGTSEMRGGFVVSALYFYRIREWSCVTWRNKPAICRDADDRDCACSEASTSGLLPNALTDSGR